MSNKTDLQENTDDIKDIKKELVALQIKCEIMAKEQSTIQKLVYGVVSIILTAVVIAITSNVIK